MITQAKLVKNVRERKNTLDKIKQDINNQGSLSGSTKKQLFLAVDNAIIDHQTIKNSDQPYLQHESDLQKKLKRHVEQKKATQVDQTIAQLSNIYQAENNNQANIIDITRQLKQEIDIFTQTSIKQLPKRYKIFKSACEGYFNTIHDKSNPTPFSNTIKEIRKFAQVETEKITHILQKHNISTKFTLNDTDIERRVKTQYKAHESELDALDLLLESLDSKSELNLKRILKALNYVINIYHLIFTRYQLKFPGDPIVKLRNTA